MHKFTRPAKRARVAVNNAILKGGGAATASDRGAMQRLSMYSQNPYFNNNFLERWQEYVTWYNTAWEARKIIDIPVDDALRLPTRFKGIDNEIQRELEDALLKFDVHVKLKRAMKQERLLGGCIILPVLRWYEDEDLSIPFDIEEVQPGDLLNINLVDLSRLARPNFTNDPFSPEYDNPSGFTISGVEVDNSRMLLFDGDALFGYNAQRYLQPQRYNPLGFGESKLAPLYDLLIRCIGTQQGAYHLVNLASVMLIEADHLRPMLGADSPAVAKLEEISRQISIYNGAIIDAKDAKVSQHSASFGSVPELVLTFAQLLAASSDIPATRFLGQSPGGLDSAGVSDARNYYDMVEAIRQTKVKPAETKLVDLIGASTFGYKKWKSYSSTMTLEYPPLWSMTDQEQAEIHRMYIEMLDHLYNVGLITSDNYAAEVNSRGVFSQNIEPDKEFIGAVVPEDNYSASDSESKGSTATKQETAS